MVVVVVLYSFFPYRTYGICEALPTAASNCQHFPRPYYLSHAHRFQPQQWISETSVDFQKTGILTHRGAADNLGLLEYGTKFWGNVSQHFKGSPALAVLLGTPHP